MVCRGSCVAIKAGRPEVVLLVMAVMAIAAAVCVSTDIPPPIKADDKEYNKATEKAKETAESWTGWAKEKLTGGLAGAGLQPDDDVRVQDKAKGAADQVYEAAKKTKDNMQEATTGAGQYASEKAGDMKDTAAEKSSDVSGKATQVKNAASEKASEIKDAAAQKISEMTNAAKETVTGGPGKVGEETVNSAKQAYETGKPKILQSDDDQEL